MEKIYKVPAICWLKITDYMRGWMEYELGCEVRAGEHRVICVQHLPGARAILRMETREETMERRPVGNTMSATMRNCIEEALKIEPTTVERAYGMTKERLEEYMPIECPKNCITNTGVLRPWTLNVYFGKEQTKELLALLRGEFWKAVEEFDSQYKIKRKGRWYPAVDMIEDFCAETNTPEIHVEALRREWQRRQSRKD